MKRSIVLGLSILLACGAVFAQDVAIYSLGFDYPLGEDSRFVPHDGYHVGGGYDYKEPAYYDSCGTTIIHPALDMNAEECPRCDKGDSVFAVSSGLVTFSGISWGNQYNVLVKHTAPPGKAFLLPNGEHETVVYSLYAHLEAVEVSAGDVVMRGQEVGRIGDYPRGSGANSHLHFEIRRVDLSASYFCGNTSDEIVDRDYVHPYDFIALNRGVNIVSGLRFSFNFPELPTNAEHHALFLLKNHSRHWVNIKDVVVAIERFDETTQSWDRTHPVDLESETQQYALAPYTVGTFFPYLTQFRYYVPSAWKYLEEGIYRAVPKALIRFGDQEFWYDIPASYADTDATREFVTRNTPGSHTRETRIMDLQLEQKSGNVYEATWTAPGRVAVGSRIAKTPVQSYDLRVSSDEITVQNFAMATPLSAPTPENPGTLQSARFTYSGNPVHVAIAEDGDPERLSNTDFNKPDCALPEGALNLRTTNVTDNGITLTWDMNGSCDYIRIHRRIDQVEDFVVIDTLAPASRTYADTGLEPETQYTYAVEPVNSCGYGPVDQVISRRTDAFVPPPPHPLYPDLVVTDLRVPAIGNKDGENFGVFVTIKNIGNIEAENVDIRAYQSEGMIRYDDEFHETSRYNVDFEVGEEQTLELLVDVPEEASDSTFSIGIWVDYRDDIPEIDELNNQLSKPITYTTFEELTFFDCTNATTGETTCTWHPDFYENFYLYNSTAQSMLYEGENTSYSFTLSPGNSDLYVGGYDTETSSFSEYAGPITVSIEPPVSPFKRTFASNGTGFNPDPPEEVDTTAPVKIAYLFSSLASGTRTAVWADEENRLTIETTVGNSKNLQAFSLSFEEIRDVQYSESISQNPVLILLTQKDLMTGTYTLELDGISWSEPQRIRHKSVYTFNFDRVLQWFTGDFDGDSQDELVSWYVYPGGGKKQDLFVWDFTGAGQISEPERWYRMYVYTINPEKIFDLECGDFNGDGKTDLLVLYKYPAPSTMQEMMVLASTGTGFLKPEKWYRENLYRFNFERIRMFTTSDVNGDARDDVVALYGYDSSQQFFTIPSTGSSFGTAEPWSGHFAKDSSNIITTRDINNDARDDIELWPMYQ